MYKIVSHARLTFKSCLSCLEAYVLWAKMRQINTLCNQEYLRWHGCLLYLLQNRLIINNTRIYSARLTKYVQAHITELYSDRQVTERNEFLYIYETVSDQKCHEAQAEVCSKWAAQHYDILTSGIQYSSRIQLVFNIFSGQLSLSSFRGRCICSTKY